MDPNSRVTNLVPIDPTYAVPLSGDVSYSQCSDPADRWIANYTAGFPSPTNFAEELFKIDQNINSKWHANVRYIHDSWNSFARLRCGPMRTSYPTIQDAYSSPTTSLVVHLTATITPTLLNEFVASYSANHIVMQNLGAMAAARGIRLGLFQNGFGGGTVAGRYHLRRQSISGRRIAQDTGYVPNGPVNSNPSYTYRDNISKISVNTT